MNTERMPEPIDALVIRNTFPDDQLQKIYSELDFIDTSVDAVWLSYVYKDINSSAIHRAIMETVLTNTVVNDLVSVNPFYSLFYNVNSHNTSIKGYSNGDSETMRADSAVFTIMSFIFDTEKRISGGSLTLQIEDKIAYQQDVENNMTIIFPSFYNLALSEVKAEEDERLYVVSSYMFIHG